MTKVLTAIENIFYENIDDILGPDRAGFEEGKARLHEHNDGAHYEQEKLVQVFLVILYLRL